ncbi:MAG: alpha/beta fold hydrolase, partial [Chloroflexota bacterium]|nr:alpha/beta fold hydrolase [Chloroflexota bacterium]
MCVSEQNDGSQLAPVAQVAADEARERFALPPACVEGYLTANGQRLHYVEAGVGPLVLLLHGFPEFWYSWRALLPTLASTHRVIALDLRGYNLS